MEEQGCRQYSAEQTGRQAGQIRQLARHIRQSGRQARKSRQARQIRQAVRSDQVGRKSATID
jgi:hypothetical protein